MCINDKLIFVSIYYYMLVISKGVYMDHLIQFLQQPCKVRPVTIKCTLWVRLWSLREVKYLPNTT